MVALSILDQLKKEHDVVKKLFKVAEDCQKYERKDIIQPLKEEIIPHARGEEKTIYSLLKQRLDDQHASDKEINLANEAYEEHRVVDRLLKELEALATSDEKWTAHLKVLKENVEHHIKEEEQELFKLIKKQFSNDMLMDLKEIYMNEKDKFTESLPAQSQIKEREPSSEAQIIL